MFLVLSDISRTRIHQKSLGVSEATRSKNPFGGTIGWNVSTSLLSRRLNVFRSSQFHDESCPCDRQFLRGTCLRTAQLYILAFLNNVSQSYVGFVQKKKNVVFQIGVSLHCVALRCMALRDFVFPEFCLMTVMLFTFIVATLVQRCSFSLDAGPFFAFLEKLCGCCDTGCGLAAARPKCCKLCRRWPECHVFLRRAI